MDEKQKKHIRRQLYAKILFNYLITAVLILFIIFAAPKILVFMWPFVVGWIIAMIANPIVRFLEKKLKLLRKHGSAIVIVLTLAIVISLLYGLVYVLIKQGIAFAHNVPELYKSAIDTLQNTIEEWRGDSSILPDGVKDFLDNANEKIGLAVNDFAKDVLSSNLNVGTAGTVVKNVAEALLMTVLTILFSYFLMAEHDNIVKTCSEKVPAPIKKTYKMVMDHIVYALVGYFKAQFKIMICIFVILSIGLMCLGTKYALLLALIIAFVDFLPVLGSGTIIWPWCVYEIIVGRYVSAIVLFVLYIVCQAVRNFLQPKMVADSIGLSPLATLFFMFVGYRFGGVLGMIVGIPVGMILVSFYKGGMFDNLIRGAVIIVSDLDKWRRF